MPFTKFSNLDFDQIKTSIKDYLRANSNFTDFDFEGSNFSILIDALAYNTYINAFNSNMIVNESFLDSATLRENVVSLSGNIGYLPRSRSCSKARVSFSIETKELPALTLKSGLVCIGSSENTSYVFSIPNNITASVSNNIAFFNNIEIFEGTYLTKQFQINTSINQKFTLDNPGIDVSTIRVYVKGIGDTGLGQEYTIVDNIIDVGPLSKIFLIQEIKDEKYQLLFGDGIFGKKLENSSVVTVTYIITEGSRGNGVSSFSFAGSLRSTNDVAVIPSNTINVTTIEKSQNGAEIETIDSIKYYAPKLYSSQYRAVTSRDYEAIIKKIYPDTETVSVVGGEELDPPEFGTVLISIKPKNGTFVSDFNKNSILNKLKQYSLSGIRQKIIDLKILYIELDSSVYYDYSKISSTDQLKTEVVKNLTNYSNSVDLNQFGGRFKYSRVLQIIDNTDQAITSNITKVKMRRDLKCSINQFTQYELCFGNKFHVNKEGFNIKSTGFRVPSEEDVVYFTDIPNEDGVTGTLSVVKPIGEDKIRIISPSAGIVNYEKGEIIISTINIISTEVPDNVIEIQSFPESNDIIGLKDLYLQFSIEKSKINMIRDVISSGDDISGVSFSKDFYTSSYSNGQLIRI